MWSGGRSEKPYARRAQRDEPISIHEYVRKRNVIASRSLPLGTPKASPGGSQ